jgi:hypothetical protein
MFQMLTLRSCVVCHPVAGLTPEGVHQAFHAQLMLHSQIARQAGVPLSSLSDEQLPSLPEALAGHARHMWLASAVDVHVSKLQTDVSGALAVAGIPNTIEWLTDDGLFSIDIAFEVGSRGGCVGRNLHDAPTCAVCGSASRSFSARQMCGQKVSASFVWVQCMCGQKVSASFVWVQVRSIGLVHILRVPNGGHKTC